MVQMYPWGLIRILLGSQNPQAGSSHVCSAASPQNELAVDFLRLCGAPLLSFRPSFPDPFKSFAVLDSCKKSIAFLLWTPKLQGWSDTHHASIPYGLSWTNTPLERLALFYQAESLILSLGMKEMAEIVMLVDMTNVKAFIMLSSSACCLSNANN